MCALCDFLLSPSSSPRLAKTGELQLRVLQEAAELQATVLNGLREKISGAPLPTPPHTSPHLPTPTHHTSPHQPTGAV